MALEIMREKFSGMVNELKIGATTREGGSRAWCVTIGGETTLPDLLEEGKIPNKPVVALEILDREPSDWPDEFKKAYGDATGDPVRWAKSCVSDFGARLLCLRLASAHPDLGGRKTSEVISFLKAFLAQVTAPLVILGCGDTEKDNELLAAVSQATKGERCLLGTATQNNYKTLAANCMADGHSIIAESPIDVNIAKQVNMLIHDMGLEPKRIIMHPTTASLGYGMEYVFSIMERARLAALAGDSMLAMPFILFAGQEVWRVKEARDSAELGVNWEIATAAAMLRAGADIIVMRHPRAAAEVTKFISNSISGDTSRP